MSTKIYTLFILNLEKAQFSQRILYRLKIIYNWKIFLLTNRMTKDISVSRCSPLNAKCVTVPVKKNNFWWFWEGNGNYLWTVGKELGILWRINSNPDLHKRLFDSGNEIMQIDFYCCTLATYRTMQIIRAFVAVGLHRSFIFTEVKTPQTLVGWLVLSHDRP